MPNDGEIKWAESIKDRLRFYRGITVTITIDIAFLLGLRFLAILEKWVEHKLAMEGPQLFSHHILEVVFVWVPTIIVVLYTLNDAILIGKRLAWRMRNA